MEKKLLVVLALNGSLAAIMLLLNWLLLKPIPTLFTIINFFSLFVFAFPLIAYYYTQYTKLRHVESMFAVFMRDFVENVRGGLTVPQAFKALTKNDYRELTPYIKKMSAQLDWGIPLEDVLSSFAREVKSKNIGRIISSVIESHHFGGNLADTFQALANVTAEIQRLRSERMTYLQSQVMTGYIIFFVFLGVMVGMERFLVPGISTAGGIGGLTAQQAVNTNIAAEFKNLFRNLVIIQGLFAGLTIGKMTEGSEIAGIKHSIFMMFIGGLVFTLAT